MKNFLNLSRTTLALLLTAAAIALPGAAWYVTGSHEAAREAQRAEEDLRQKARQTAELIAENLGGNLRNLAEAENKRPYFHFQNLYHDPQGAYEGNSVIPSPLASGPLNPLIRAYFQVQPNGEVELPTYNGEIPGLNKREDASLQEALFKEFKSAGLSCTAALRQVSSSRPLRPEPAQAHAQELATQERPQAKEGQAAVTPQPDSRAQTAQAPAQELLTQGRPHAKEGQAAAVPQPDSRAQTVQAPAQELLTQGEPHAQEGQAAAVPQPDSRAQMVQAPVQEQGVQGKPQVEERQAASAQQRQASSSLQSASPGDRQAGQGYAPRWQKQKMDNDTWMQNSSANRVYEQILRYNYNKGKGEPANPVAQQEVKGGQGELSGASPQPNTPQAQSSAGEAGKKDPPPSAPQAQSNAGKAGQEDPPPSAPQAPLSASQVIEEDPAPSIPPNFLSPAFPVSPGEITINVGDFQWRTVEIGGAPALVALREVETPAGVLTQGFQVALAELVKAPQGSALSVRVLPGAPAGEEEAELPLLGAAWRVVLDDPAGWQDARTRTGEIRTGFYWTFGIGLAIAAVAGLCAVALVWQAERLARQRSQFAAAAAHELRTPLAGLRMYGEMLAEGLGDPAKSKAYARRVAGEAERLGRVVGNVLNFTRLERGTLALKPEHGDLAAVVRDCLARQQPALEAAGARVELQLPEELPQALFDRDAVSHILQNLLDNAEKYTRAAADRTIRVALRPDARARGVVLSVTDRGPGISAELSPRLFRLFARGADPDAPPGLGLGLALSKALARAQGGDVVWTTMAQGGAEFRVSFPS